MDSHLPHRCLLSVRWTTLGDLSKSPDGYSPSLFLGSDGFVTHVEETPMRPLELFSRYYPNEEAEKLFDSIIPSIEAHAVQMANPPADYNFITFVYQTTEGTLTHDCVLADLEPITSLLAKLEAGGTLEAPAGHPPVQVWARKRFDRFLPPPSPLEQDPAAALEIKTDFNRP